jgi:hypothetical protein
VIICNSSMPVSMASLSSFLIIVGTLCTFCALCHFFWSLPDVDCSTVLAQ